MKALKYRSALAVAAAGLVGFGFAGGAQAMFIQGAPFTVDETNPSLGLGDDLDDFQFDPSNISADSFSGSYQELLTINGVTNTFEATAWWRASSFRLDGGEVSSNLSASAGDPERAYGLYAVFNSSGDFEPGVGFTGDLGDITFYLDPDRDTDFSFTDDGDAGAGVTRSDTGDDIEVGSSTLLSQADGEFEPGDLSEGDFTLIFEEFMLTGEGEDYFVDPNPFYEALQVTGQFDSDDEIVVGEETQTFRISEVSADGQYGSVPTPGGLALVGVGLLAMGYSGRRLRNRQGGVKSF